MASWLASWLHGVWIALLIDGVSLKRDGFMSSSLHGLMASWLDGLKAAWLEGFMGSWPEVCMA